MESPLGRGWIEGQNTLSRLDEAKQVFRNAISRMVGYHLVDTHVGLVTFSGSYQIEVAAELSQVRQDFNNKLEDVSTVSSTAIWDALQKSGEILVSFKLDYAETKLRIIVLTDGEDNTSFAKPDAVCKYLYDSEIVVDSLVIGTTSTSGLFKISKHTGGYAFCPSLRLLLFQTFLLEPFLSLSARPNIVRVPFEDCGGYAHSLPKEPDMKTVYDFSPCRPHKLESGEFISLSTASLFFLQRSGSSYGLPILSAARNPHGRDCVDNHAAGALTSDRSTQRSVTVSTRPERSPSHPASCISMK
jgi:hypothetical protein